MRDRVFVDANVLVYMRDATEQVKQKKAGRSGPAATAA